MKKSLLLISLFTLSLASFTSCALDNQQSSKVDSNNVLLLQAATGINMIKDVTTFRNARSVETKNTALSEKDTNKIKEILPTVDLLLDNKKTFSSTLEEVNLEIIDEIDFPPFVIIDNEYHFIPFEDYKGNMLYGSITISEFVCPTNAFCAPEQLSYSALYSFKIR